MQSANQAGNPEASSSEQLFAEFEHYLQLSDEMVGMSSKEALERTARILAMQAAYYARKYGADPLIDLGELLAGPAMDADGATFLRDGAKTFVGVLGVVAGGLRKDSEDTLQ